MHAQLLLWQAIEDKSTCCIHKTMACMQEPLACTEKPLDIEMTHSVLWFHSGFVPRACVHDHVTQAPGENTVMRRHLGPLTTSNPNQPMVNFVRLGDSLFHFHLADVENNPHHLCLATYYLPEGFEPKSIPHGNSKSCKPFYPTLPSTMKKIKDDCAASGPKQVIANVSACVGGIMGAADACELPRDEQQVSQAKLRLKSSTSAPSSYGGAPGDELSAIMHKAFLEDKSNLFIRDVKLLPEPAVVVATDRQLDDMVRFCSDSSEFGILTIDPTFSLGAFDVTVATYRHLLLLSRKTQKPPVFIGPVLIHYKKTFATYLFFASSLVGLRRELAGVKCFGTDGETALIDAFQHGFPSSIHLTCSIHMRRNVKAKLTELRISEGMKQMILDDLFGKKVGSHYAEGLVDVRDEATYDTALLQLANKWEALDSSKEGPIHTFVRWFHQFKSASVKKCMLRLV